MVLGEILVERDVFRVNSENLRAPIWTVPSWSVQSAFTSEDDCNIDPKSTKLLIFFSSYYFKYIKYILLFYLSFLRIRKHITIIISQIFETSAISNYEDVLDVKSFLTFCQSRWRETIAICVILRQINSKKWYVRSHVLNCNQRHARKWKLVLNHENWLLFLADHISFKIDWTTIGKNYEVGLTLSWNWYM